MGQFLNGLFIGFGVGLFIAPQTGEETRRMIMERVVALRKSMVSENEQHFSIEAHPSQVPPLAAQPATDFSSEPQVQGITSESAAQPATEFFSEPGEQKVGSERPAQASETFSSEPQVQGIPSESAADSTSTSINENIDVAGTTSSVADMAQTTSSMDTGFAPDAHPEQQTPTETLRPDTAITDKLPPLSSPSNVPSRTTRRKTSTRTPNTSRNRGHSRS